MSEQGYALSVKKYFSFQHPPIPLFTEVLEISSQGF